MEETGKSREKYKKGDNTAKNSRRAWKNSEAFFILLVNGKRQKCGKNEEKSDERGRVDFLFLNAFKIVFKTRKRPRTRREKCLKIAVFCVFSPFFVFKKPVSIIKTSAFRVKSGMKTAVKMIGE